MNGQKSGLVGQSVLRVEDDRLLRGKGQYVADVTPDGCLHAAFVRSPFPHARIVSIDTSAAKAHPGVHAVFTGADIEKMTTPFLPGFMLPGLYTPLYYALSSERVRLVGDPVAIVIADSRYIAEDGVELVEVEYEELPAVGTMDQALDPKSEKLWDKADGNVLYEGEEKYGEVDEVFAKADHVITESFDCPRQSNQPMETRGIVADVKADGSIDVHATTQAHHMLRWQLAAYTQPIGGFRGLGKFLGNRGRRKSFFSEAKAFMGENKESLDKQDNAGAAYQIKKDRSTLRYLGRAAMTAAGKRELPRVLARDIGGGFGSKGAVNREDVAVVAAALELGRPVKWIGDRGENLADGGQAREERFKLSMAVDDDGTIRGMKASVDVDNGAYPGNPISGIATVHIMRVLWPGGLRLEGFQWNARLFATNKGRHIPYRGPWANETWTRERMLNIVAKELGMSQAEVRMKNLRGEEDFPCDMITGPTLDVTMSTRKTLEKALEYVDFEQFEKERADAAARGHKLGLGIASYHEPAPGPPNYWDALNPGNDALLGEGGQAEIQADGSVLVYTPQMPHGQSHETTYAQIAADNLGVKIEDVTVVYGDTSRTSFSFLGTGGSRGGPIGGGNVRAATRALREKVVERAADMLEASVEDIVITDGNVHVAGVPARGITLAALFEAAEPDELKAAEQYAGAGDGGWSCATHVCWVDVDLATGKVDIPRYLVSEDCGPIINPAIVDGQVRGGVAQGIGAVLYERLVYNDEAVMQSGTYMDYLVPTAMEIPDIEVVHIETLSKGENDYRGVGEGGMLGAPAAITNAISDALGVQVTDQYLPPAKILELAGVIDGEA